MSIYQKVKQKLTTIIFFILVFSFVPLALEYYFVTATTADYWFKYQAIEVRDVVDFEDHTIDVFSFANIHRPVLIEWNDVLYCSKDGQKGFAFIDSQGDSKYFTAPTVLPRFDVDPITQEQTLIPWRFGVDKTLIAGDHCYIESTIAAKLRFDIERSQTIRSNTFVIQ